MRRHLLLAAAAVLGMACVRSGLVQVAPTGSAVEADPRPADCKLEFFHTRAPERPYDELATLHWSGEGGPAEAQEELRARACTLGAHAVVVSREFVPAAGYAGSSMTGTAVVYRGFRASDAGKVPPPLPLPPATASHVDPTVKSGPAGERLVPARLRQVATLRDRPERGARDLGYVDAGTDLWASEAPANGFRLVLLTDGRTGHLPAGPVEILPMPTAAAAR